MYTLFANSATNASLESTSTIAICGRGMRNVLSVNGMAFNSNSELCIFIYTQAMNSDAVTYKLPEL